MFIVSRPDEGIITDIEFFPALFEVVYHQIGMLFCRSAFFLGGLFDLLAMLIGTGEKKDITSHEPVVSGQDVGRYRCVSMPDMGYIVHIIDRSCDIETFSVTLF
jgi:hypothetical protein